MRYQNRSSFRWLDHQCKVVGKQAFGNHHGTFRRRWYPPDFVSTRDHQRAPHSVVIFSKCKNKMIFFVRLFVHSHTSHNVKGNWFKMSLQMKFVFNFYMKLIANLLKRKSRKISLILGLSFFTRSPLSCLQSDVAVM